MVFSDRITGATIPTTGVILPTIMEAEAIIPIIREAAIIPTSRLTGCTSGRTS